MKDHVLVNFQSLNLGYKLFGKKIYKIALACHLPVLKLSLKEYPGIRDIYM